MALPRKMGMEILCGNERRESELVIWSESKNITLCDNVELVRGAYELLTLLKDNLRFAAHSAGRWLFIVLWNSEIHRRVFNVPRETFVVQRTTYSGKS